MAAETILSQAGATGFVFGIGLIFSLGPQNLALLQAGMTRNRPVAVASIGYASEVVLVLMGIGGLAALISSQPAVSTTMQALGVTFLAWCGFKALTRSATKAGNAGQGEAAHGLRAVSHMLVVTWLNPLVWLEAVLLVGVLASGFGAEAKTAFAAGFLIASAIKFYGWSLVGSLVSGLATRPGFRTGLDRVAGTILLAAALMLAMHIATSA